MKHIITITGDMNDADDCEASSSIDLDKQVFSGWGDEFKNLDVTFKKFFITFGEVLEEFSKANPHTANWSNRTYRNEEDAQTSRSKVLTSFRNKLNLEELCEPCDLMEILCDFVPGSFDYPVHTIYGISAIPETDKITFY